MTRPALAICSVAVLVTLTATADARQATRPDTPEPPTTEDGAGGGADGGGILAGPKVESKSDDPARDAPRRFQVDVPLPYWFSTVRELDLSETQRIDIQEVVVEFQLAQRQFRRFHGGEMRNLRRQIGLARRADEPVDPAKRKRLAELQATVPQSEATQARIWEMLTSEQQESARKTLEEIRARIAEQRAVRRDDGAGTTESAENAPPGEVSRRRLEFLRKHRSRSREGGDATPAERAFDFDEND